MTVLTEPQIEHIRVLHLDPKDLLLFQFSEPSSDKEAQTIKDRLGVLLEPYVNPEQILVICGDVNIDILRPSQRAALTEAWEDGFTAGANYAQDDDHPGLEANPYAD